MGYILNLGMCKKCGERAVLGEDYCEKHLEDRDKSGDYEED
jgi:hypothetical protein